MLPLLLAGYEILTVATNVSCYRLYAFLEPEIQKEYLLGIVWLRRTKEFYDTICLCKAGLGLAMH
jgi:hypothetical protein